MTTFYIQCLLQKNNDNQVAWLPKKYAINGRYVKLKEDDG
jgi:hypothetical protein